MDEAVARRYLLGDATEGDRATIEETYFRNAEAADRVAQVEEELIEDYLAGHLAREDRARFERVYLASPAHRIRLETIRRLTRPARGRTVARRTWFALAAAAVVILTIGALWMLAGSRELPRTSAARETTPALPGAASPAGSPEAEHSAARIPPPVFAISLSPLNVRGAGGAPARHIPPDVTIVVLQLEGEPADGPANDARMTIGSMEGRTVWKGAAVTGSAAGIVARADVPSTVLKPGDYIVRFFASDAAGREQERGRYFLRLR